MRGTVVRNAATRSLSGGAALAALLVLGAGLTSADIASAAGGACVSTTNPPGAQGCFDPAGDHIRATDTAGDGHHVEVFWSVGRYSGVCKNFDGANTTKDCNEDFAENSTVCFRAAVVEGSTIVGDYSDRRCTSTS